ncbi:Palmitoyl-protein thioesterase 1, partial [Marasmius crinis-equi]
MSASGSSTPPSPISSASTPPSSVPSPQMNTLSLSDPVTVSEEDKKAAAEIKAKANKAFSSHDFVAAIDLYTQAIEKNPAEPTLWCNRAYARMKLEEFGYALNDASGYLVRELRGGQALQLDPKYAKAYYRRATCHLQTLKHQSAISDFKKVLAIEPSNDTVRNQMISTQKLLRKLEFEKAIEMEEEKSAVERCREIISEGGCFVEQDYAGPVLSQEGDKYTITLEFVKEMIQWFKDGKKLPRRYVWEIVMGAYEHFAKEASLVE